jgi:hypothetical protein
MTINDETIARLIEDVSLSAVGRENIFVAKEAFFVVHIFVPCSLYPHHRFGYVETVITDLFKVGEDIDENKTGVNSTDSFVEPLYMSLSQGFLYTVNSLLVSIGLWFDIEVPFPYSIDRQCEEFAAHGVDLPDVVHGRLRKRKL